MKVLPKKTAPAQKFAALGQPVAPPPEPKTFTFPAPWAGWVTNKSLAQSMPQSALVLDNWFPLARSARIRGGSTKAATLNDGSAAIESMWTYNVAGTEKFFGADETSVYEISAVADADTQPDPIWANQTAGYYSTVQIGTSGGNFLYAVNGADPALLYDGADLYEITDEATYGLAYDALSADFAEGETVTGGTSGASAEIVHIEVLTGTTGILHVKNITSGPFQNDETITDGATGSATSNIPSGVSTINSTVVTSADTSTWSQGWLFANRLFFVRKDTMIADYLPVDAVGGAATQVSMAGVFQLGGALLFGATWSLDSGSGLDDKCIFVSTRGEVAVYEGSDPSDSAAWSKVGVYKLANPISINAHTKAGGDLIVATDEGIVPLTEAVRKDVAALSLSAVTRNIEPDWRAEAAVRTTLPWEIVKWDSNNMLLVSLPKTSDTIEPVMFVANLETGAWCRFTGWDVRCLAVYQKQGYYGTSDGKVFQMEVGGQDDEAPFTAVYASAFDDCDSPATTKTATNAYVTFRATAEVTPQVSVSGDYATEIPAAPAATTQGGDSLWGTAQWGVDVWSSGLELDTRSRWIPVGRTGKSFSAQVQITSGSGDQLSVELVTSTLLYQSGAMQV